MSPYHILIVEDDPDINGLLEKLLTRAGYHARPAFSGSEGKMCLEQYQYDLVLLDLMLPGVTGEELVAQIRRSSTVPIIIISAKASVADRIDLLKLGADDFICKPFDVGEVLARVEAQLRRAVAFSEAGRSPASEEPAGFPDRPGIQNPAPAHVPPQKGLHPRKSLYPGLGGRISGRGQHRQCAHQQYPQQARQNRSGHQLYQNRVGHRV